MISHAFFRGNTDLSRLWPLVPASIPPSQLCQVELFVHLENWLRNSLISSWRLFLTSIFHRSGCFIHTGGAIKWQVFNDRTAQSRTSAEENVCPCLSMNDLDVHAAASVTV